MFWCCKNNSSLCESEATEGPQLPRLLAPVPVLEAGELDKQSKMVAVGDKLKAARLFKVHEAVQIDEYVAGRKVIITGMPGAFTPTCTSAHVPSFMNSESVLKAKEVAEVIVMCPNDGFVMAGWKQSLGVKDNSILTFLADPYLFASRAWGLTLVADKLNAAGLGVRCQRFTLIVDNGVVKHVAVADNGNNECTYADATITALQ